eukprot:171682-Pelagomonas_calceolata.AAC.1
MAVAVHCQSLYLSLTVMRARLSQPSRSFSGQGVTGKRHGDFNPEVGKGIPRAYELGWFALYQDLVFEQTSGKVCHWRIAPEVSALWTREAA